MSMFEDVMAKMAMGDGQSERWAPSGTRDEMVERLTYALEEYMKPCQFKKGDIVTPREGANLKGRGNAFIVVEVYPERRHVTSHGAPTEMNDMLVGVLLGGSIKFFEAESIDYEPL